MIAGFLLRIAAAAAQQSAPADESSVIKLGGDLMVAGKAYEYDRQLAGRDWPSADRFG